MTAHQEYLAAVQNAQAKKESFLTNAQVARNRISPSRLKQDAKDKIRNTIDTSREKARETVRAHPTAVGLAGVGLLAYLFRRPLYKLTKRLSTRLKTPAEPVGLRAEIRERFSSFRNALSRSITEIRHEE